MTIDEILAEVTELVQQYDDMIADANADQMEGSIDFAGDAYDLLVKIKDALQP